MTDYLILPYNEISVARWTMSSQASPKQINCGGVIDLLGEVVRCWLQMCELPSFLAVSDIYYMCIRVCLISTNRNTCS